VIQPPRVRLGTLVLMSLFVTTAGDSIAGAASPTSLPCFQLLEGKTDAFPLAVSLSVPLCVYEKRAPLGAGPVGQH
jgi:hypothetical protein